MVALQVAGALSLGLPAAMWAWGLGLEILRVWAWGVRFRPNIQTLNQVSRSARAGAARSYVGGVTLRLFLSSDARAL